MSLEVSKSRVRSEPDHGEASWCRNCVAGVLVFCLWIGNIPRVDGLVNSWWRGEWIMGLNSINPDGFTQAEWALQEME